MTKKLKPIAAAAATTLALSTSAIAASFITLSIADIAGESQLDDCEKCIDVIAWSWGMSQSGTQHTGGGGDQGKASVQDLSFTHYVDSSSVLLYKNVAEGKVIPEATLSVRKAIGDGEFLKYLEIKMEDLIVSSASTGDGGGGEIPTENVTLNFAKFTTKYTGQEDDGTKGSPIEYCFDIVRNVRC